RVVVGAERVEHVGVGVAARVAVAGAEEHQHAAAGRHGYAGDLGVGGGEADHEVGGRLVAQDLLDVVAGQLGLGAQRGQQVRPVQQQGEAVAEQVGGGDEPGVEQGDQVGQQLGVAELVGLHADQGAEQVLAGFGAALGGQVGEVSGQLDGGGVGDRHPLVGAAADLQDRADGQYPR